MVDVDDGYVLVVVGTSRIVLVGCSCVLVVVVEDGSSRSDFFSSSFRVPFVVLLLLLLACRPSSGGVDGCRRVGYLCLFVPTAVCYFTDVGGVSFIDFHRAHCSSLSVIAFERVSCLLS